MRTVVYKASQVVQKHFMIFMMVKKLQGGGLLHVISMLLKRLLRFLSVALIVVMAKLIYLALIFKFFMQPISHICSGIFVV